ISQLSYSQNYDVIYKATFKPDKTDKTYTEEDQFMLSIRGNQSLYYSVSYLMMMANQAEAKKKNIDINKISSNYFIDKKSDKLLHRQVVGRQLMEYEDNALPKWKISNEYKVIDSMKCKKASTHFRGRDYIAWFSEEIAIPEGPYKFKNAPGLIVAIESKDGDYQYQLVSLKKSENPIPPIPNGVLLKDRKQYIDQLKKLAENPSYEMQQQDQARNTQQKDYVQGKEVSQAEKYKLFNEFVWSFMKKHNNPIETDDIWIR
ncbi:MAG: GLPGLI family protein, partial [Bergeyella zoohelcum]|nr:GLPGLI family protein [Bergeyella zoohelcum]